MFSYYFTIALIYVVIGFAVALFFFFILRKKAMGSFWGALAVAVIGSFLGGVLDFFFSDFISKLANLANAVNVFPALVFSFFVLWIYSRFSHHD